MKKRLKVVIITLNSISSNLFNNIYVGKTKENIYK